MTEKTLKQARWYQNGPDSWLLKLPIKDGGWVLASATANGTGFVCEVGGVRWAWVLARRVAR